VLSVVSTYTFGFNKPIEAGASVVSTFILFFFGVIVAHFEKVKSVIPGSRPLPGVNSVP